MIKFSLEMLWSERRKVYGLCTSMVMTLSICLLFLQFLMNPNLTQKITSIDIFQFSETFCISLFGLFILAVCVSLICYSCNYYMKLHAREIGMVKMAGFSQGKIVLYQLIQMITIMVVSVIITFCLSLVTTPIFLTIVYRYCHIHQNVFYFNTRLFSMIGILVVCILIILIGMQINYINNNSLSSLIKDKYITTQKEDHRVFIIPDYIYILGYFLGLYAMYVGEELDAGFAIASCIGAISAYGLFYYFIPHTLNEMVDSLNLKGEDTIVLGDLALFMQQSKLLIVFIMLAVILIPTFIFSSLHMKMLHIALHIGAVLINFVLCLSVVSRFDIDALEKKEHFKNLCKMGLTNKEVKKISYKEGNGFYIVLWIFAGIYILSIACTFLIRASIDLGLVGIVLLEFIVPYGMAEFIVYLKKRGQNYELHGN
ncbi:MAG: FtsX-like permease family protein [Faecalibacillus intestinalis]|uniref:FtsX-like permease family protein n=3 Tax=Faecalibacillus intestinalis TaxID=1982626 RepID=UPI003992B2F6